MCYVIPAIVEWIDGNDKVSHYSIEYEQIIQMRNTGLCSMVVIRRADGLLTGTVIENWRILCLN